MSLSPPLDMSSLRVMGVRWRVQYSCGHCTPRPRPLGRPLRRRLATPGTQRSRLTFDSGQRMDVPGIVGAASHVHCCLGSMGKVSLRRRRVALSASRLGARMRGCKPGPWEGARVKDRAGRRPAPPFAQSLRQQHNQTQCLQPLGAGCRYPARAQRHARGRPRWRQRPRCLAPSTRLRICGSHPQSPTGGVRSPVPWPLFPLPALALLRHPPHLPPFSPTSVTAS